MNQSAPAAVGCVQEETGQMYSQQADGLMGLGNSRRSLPAQVGASARGGPTGMVASRAALALDARLPA
jgi:hypothetical protein